MDAPEDRDLKLQKVSGGLFINFKTQLALLLYEDPAHNVTATKPQEIVRRDVPEKEVTKLVLLLEPFQEWPQLLDPELAGFMEQLTSAFLSCLTGPASPQKASTAAVGIKSDHRTDLLTAISKVLYTMAKIRGQKVIMRFLPNEPKYLEPMLGIFDWEGREVPSAISGTGRDAIPKMAWELRYIALLWTSHLLLTPFDLVTISNDPLPEGIRDGKIPVDLPPLATRILVLGLKYIDNPGKERDAAAGVLVRLIIRKDTRDVLSEWMLNWITSLFRQNESSATAASTEINVFLVNGALATLAGILSSSERSALSVEDFILVAYRQVVRKIIEDETSPVNNNAQVSKLLCKIQKNIATLLLPSTLKEEDDIPETVEEIIDTLLNALGDRDTLVRYAASKALSATCLRLSSSEREQILGAVFDMYEINVFYPNRASTTLDDKTKMKKDLSQVSAALWHGLTLTLATFLRSATAGAEMLPKVVDCIITALSFEQRKTTFALGSNVRDAACYAAWSLARNYSTETLISVPMRPPYPASKSIPQIIAEELVTTACLDPSGNIRRAASAALQELIGRHPDIVDQGIPLVQAVDYSSVALRSRAVTEVSYNAALLGHRSYWIHLVNGLVDSWRGIAAQDADGRRIAAQGLGDLIREAGQGDAGRRRAWSVVLRVVERVGTGGGADVEIRHGGWLALATCLDSIACIPDAMEAIEVENVPDDSIRLGEIAMQNIFKGIRSRIFTNSIWRPELACEAGSRLIQSLSRSTINAGLDIDPDKATLALRRLYLAILDVSLYSPEDVVLSTALQALSAFFPVLKMEQRTSVVKVWLAKLSAKANRKGIVKALGVVLGHLSDSNGAVTQVQEEVLSGILKAAQSSNVNTRVAAIGALCDGALPIGLDTNSILIRISQGLDDYSIDQRGDVGSWTRLESIRAVSAANRYGCFASQTSSNGKEPSSGGPIEEKIVRQVIRLAVEKLDKVRLKASETLFEIFSKTPEWGGGIFKNITPESEFWTSADVYFMNSLKILTVNQFRLDFLEGYVASAGAGSGSTLRISGRVMIQFLDKLNTAHAETGPVTDVALTDMMENMVNLLKKSISISEDRVLVPLLEVLASWFESGILVKLEGTYKFQELFTLVQQAHLKSGNVHKLSAAVKVYAGLTSISSLKMPARRKLVSMLVHPFPKVRSDVADALYLTLTTEGEHEDAEVLIMDTDWMVPPKDLKDVVTQLKIELTI